eukprot:2451262-Pyramimonas_sp.AAC.1
MNGCRRDVGGGGGGGGGLEIVTEVIGAYNVASLAVEKEDGQSVSMFAMVSAVATGVWRALQRYGAVPAKWG